jgi:hypothetical protein
MKHPGDEVVAKKIREARGNVTAAARALNVTRSSVYNWIRSSEMLQQVVQDERESFLDVAETKLQDHILRDDITSLIFFLKTQGRNRGYVERRENEISGRGGEPLTIEVVPVAEKDEGNG